MEQRAAFERAVEEMEWGDVVSTLEGAIVDMLYVVRNTTPLPSSPPPPPPPPSPPLVPTGLDLNTDPQPVQHLGGGDVGRITQGAAPNMVAAPAAMYRGPQCQPDTMHPGHLSNQAGAYSQGQHINAPVVRFPGGITRNLRCIGLLNGEEVYELPADVCSLPLSAAPPLNTVNPKKRGRPRQAEDQQPYVKKPPNAFMLFMKEQRKSIEAEVSIKGSATINTVLGQKWQSMTKEEQAKYFELAHVERLLHNQQYPAWSCSNNYGKKRMRRRRKAPIGAEASAGTQQPRTLSLTPVNTAVVDSYTQPGVSSLPQIQTGVSSLPQIQTGVSSLPQIQTGVSSLPHTQTGVSSLPQIQNGVSSLPHTQTGVSLPQIQTGVSSLPYTQTGVSGLSYTQPGMMEPGHPQTVAVQLQNVPTRFTMPVCDMCHQPLVCPSCLNPPRTASLASPALLPHTESSLRHTAQPQLPSSVHMDRGFLH